MFNVGILNDLLEILSLKIEEKLAETLFNLYNKLTELIKEEMEFIAN